MEEREERADAPVRKSEKAVLAAAPAVLEEDEDLASLSLSPLSASAFRLCFSSYSCLTLSISDCGTGEGAGEPDGEADGVEVEGAGLANCEGVSRQRASPRRQDRPR